MKYEGLCLKLKYFSVFIINFYLYSTDGGQTRENRCIRNAFNEWGRKIFFPSKNIGYISLENENSAHMLKSINAGNNAQSKMMILLK